MAVEADVRNLPLLLALHPRERRAGQAMGWRMKHVKGTVLFVQEGRFTLETDAGDRRLFILSHKASVEPQQLPPLQHRQAHVRVSYDDAPDLIAKLAHAVELVAE